MYTALRAGTRVAGMTFAKFVSLLARQGLLLLPFNGCVNDLNC